VARLFLLGFNFSVTVIGIGDNMIAVAMILVGMLVFFGFVLWLASKMEERQMQ
jgi:hypothetical protein